MAITIDDLNEINRETGFRAIMLEKVIHLGTLLNALNQHPELKEQWVLKGGTGLNLFYLDLPRLSVDIDLNFIGTSERHQMEKDRPHIDEALTEVCKRTDFDIDRISKGHALTKFQLKYPSVFGGRGEIQIDMSYLYRQCLIPYHHRSTNLLNGHLVTQDIPVLDIHEIAAGKLAALLSRRQSRDLFDAAQLAYFPHFEEEKLKLCATIMLAASGKQWQEINANNISYRLSELKNQLIPTLSQKKIEHLDENGWQNSLLQDSKRFLDRILPFDANQKMFFDLCAKEGIVKPALITPDKNLQSIVINHPVLLWEVHKLKTHGKKQDTFDDDSKNDFILLSDVLTRKLIAFIKSYLNYQKAIEDHFAAIGQPIEHRNKETIIIAEDACKKIARTIMADENVWQELVKANNIETVSPTLFKNELALWQTLEQKAKAHQLTPETIKHLSNEIQKMSSQNLSMNNKTTNSNVIKF